MILIGLAKIDIYLPIADLKIEEIISSGEILKL